jgi:hypothetical protein
MKDDELPDAAPEAGAALAVHVESDAAANGDRWVAGKYGGIPPTTHGGVKELAHCHTRLDHDRALTAIEIEQSIEAARADGHHTFAGARETVAQPGASWNGRNPAREDVEEVTVTIGPCKASEGALRAVEADKMPRANVLDLFRHELVFPYRPLGVFDRCIFH